MKCAYCGSTTHVGQKPVREKPSLHWANIGTRNQARWRQFNALGEEVPIVPSKPTLTTERADMIWDVFNKLFGRPPSKRPGKREPKD